MKRWIVVLVLLLTVAPFARADEASKRAKVQELFVVMKMDSNMEQVTKSIMRQVQGMFSGMTHQEMSPQQKKIAEDYQDRLHKLVMGTMAWKALQPEYLDLYASTYTEDEINGILAFYKSPAGQAMLSKTPELMTKGTAISQHKLNDLEPQMKALMDEMSKELQKDAPPSTSATPAPKTP